MKKSLIALGVVLAWQGTAQAQSLPDGIASAVKWGNTAVQLRYRYEYVDQDKTAHPANASTLKSRLTWNSGVVNGYKGLVEVDNVSVIGAERYNSTVNGLTSYPTVADPEATIVNQAALSYSADTWNTMLGRQRIVHGNERFVGSVAWRQLEQTFDAAHLVFTPNSALSMDYAYSWRINTVFGPDSPNGQLDGDFHLFRTDYKVTGNQTVSAFAYLLDYNDPVSNSSNTYGVEYTGALLPFLKPHLAYASQSDAGDNTTDYSARYYLAELAASWHGFTLTPGYEVLGSDTGKKGFATPLATLHKFQGFADKFLTTPANGIRDTYIELATKRFRTTTSLTWHSFKSDENGQDYGNEVDFAVAYPITNYLTGMVKYAHFNADQVATDTDKAWVMATMKF